MGVDQHPGQNSGEWIDTDTGELQRTRVAPADRAGVRKFLSRFRGQELVVQELHSVGAQVGSRNSSAISAPEDAARRRFAAAKRERIYRRCR
ncbi:MAG TPA: hypothetical protein VHX88_08895 [Solirubrobacteraceae bacterium]|nr:hypothetical protein [Solirubrobacteraceae bacterium]